MMIGIMRPSAQVLLRLLVPTQSTWKIPMMIGIMSFFQQHEQKKILLLVLTKSNQT